jgi:transposase
MSKAGNGRLRRAMCFLAMTALRFNSAVKAFGDRLKERGKETMVVIGAAMRKLLYICYGVLKSGRPFDPSLHRVVGLWTQSERDVQPPGPVKTPARCGSA